MAITEIDTVASTDTFEKQRMLVNEGLIKLNSIDLNKNTLILEDRSHAAVTNTDATAGSFGLYMDDASGDIFVIVKKAGTTDAKRFRLVDYDDSSTDGSNGVSYVDTFSS